MKKTTPPHSNKKSATGRLTPIRITLLYAAFAALWIIASDQLLAITVDDVVVQAQIELVKGLAFVAITSAVLYALLESCCKTLDETVLSCQQQAKAEHELNIANLSLKESQIHAQSLIDAVLDGVISMDKAGKIIAWNVQAAHIFGYSSEQALGREVAELIVPPVHREAHRQGIARFLKTGMSTIINTRIETLGMRADGSEFPIEVSISIIEQQGSYFFNAYIRDITERKQTQKLLQEKDALLSESQHLAHIGSWRIKLANEHHVWSDETYRIFGVTPETFDGSTEAFFALLHPDDRAAMQEWTALCLAEKQPPELDFRIIRPDGSIRFIRGGGGLQYDDITKQPSYIVGNTQDITERKRTEDELRIAAIAFESQEAMVVTDAKQVILKVNQAFTRTTGYSAEEAIGNTPALLKSGNQDKQFYVSMWEALNRDKFWQGEIWNRRKNGELYPEWLSISAVTDINGQVSNYVAAFADITANKKLEETIHHLAFYDPLTKLPNRRLLIERLQQSLNASTRHINHGAILFIDLDNFKELNDIRGYDIGDLLLVEVAKRLQLCARSNDTVACLGGDDFVFILEDLNIEVEQAAIQAESIAEKIHIAISQPFDLRGQQYHNAASIGISLFCNHDASLDDLLKYADNAMYQAKQCGRNTIRFFDPVTHAAMEARIKLEADLRLALSNNQFRLHYQMQVDSTGKILGAEVLIRWQHPEHGLMSPIQFVPLIEESGLIIPIGLWVLETACRQIKCWELNTHTHHLQLAVNVSVIQFRQSNFVEQVCAVLEKTAVDPSKLKLELTESIVLEDVDDTITKIRSLKKIGVYFSIDDFGTGYSSLSYLSRLPLDQLKIDQSFVCNIGVKLSDAVIVQTIIGMAKNLDMEVIAEGVETEYQREFLELNGCHHYQGYLFSKPVPLEAFEQLLINPPDVNQRHC